MAGGKEVYLREAMMDTSAQVGTRKACFICLNCCSSEPGAEKCVR